MDAQHRVPFVCLDLVLLLVGSFGSSDSKKGIFISQTIISKGRGRVTNISSNVIIHGKDDTGSKFPQLRTRRTGMPSSNSLLHAKSNVEATAPRFHSTTQSQHPRTISWRPAKLYTRRWTSSWVLAPVTIFPNLPSMPPSKIPQYRRRRTLKHVMRKRTIFASTTQAPARSSGHTDRLVVATAANTTVAASTSSTMTTKAQMWARLFKHFRKDTSIGTTRTCTEHPTTKSAFVEVNLPAFQDTLRNYYPQNELSQEDQQIDYGWSGWRNQRYDYASRVDQRRYRRYKRDVKSVNSTEQTADNIDNYTDTYNGTEHVRRRRETFDTDTRAMLLILTVLFLLLLASMIWYTPNQPLDGHRQYIRLQPRQGSYAKLPTDDPDTDNRFICVHNRPSREGAHPPRKEKLTFKEIASAKVSAHRLRNRFGSGDKPSPRRRAKGRRKKRTRAVTISPGSSSSSADRVKRKPSISAPARPSSGSSFGFQTSASPRTTSSATTEAEAVGSLRVIVDNKEKASGESNMARFIVTDVPESTTRVMLQVQLKRKLSQGATQIYCKEVTFDFDGGTAL